MGYFLHRLVIAIGPIHQACEVYAVPHRKCVAKLMIDNFLQHFQIYFIFIFSFPLQAKALFADFLHRSNAGTIFNGPEPEAPLFFDSLEGIIAVIDEQVGQNGKSNSTSWAISYWTRSSSLLHHSRYPHSHPPSDRTPSDRLCCRICAVWPSPHGRTSLCTFWCARWPQLTACSERLRCRWTRFPYRCDCAAWKRTSQIPAHLLLSKIDCHQVMAFWLDRSLGWWPVWIFSIATSLLQGNPGHTFSLLRLAPRKGWLWCGLWVGLSISSSSI